MSLLYQFLWFQKLRAWIDGIWTLASLVCVPSLAAISFYWATGDSGFAQITQHGATTEVHAVAGELANIKNSVSIKTPMEVMRYQMILVEAQTQTQVFSYPPQQANDKELGNVLIQLPSDLKIGSYELYADVLYPANPLKASEFKVRIAEIKIDREQ